MKSKYLLKYQIKSKYLGFAREEEKEFNNKNEVYKFLRLKRIKKWTIYERTNSCLFTTYNIGSDKE